MAVAEVRYRYRLRTTAEQRRLLQGVFDACRAVWNQALGRWSDLWCHEGDSLYYRDADLELTDWRGRFEWLAAQPSVPQQQMLRDLYRSISAFFDKSNPAGRPRFKSRKAGHATARWTRNGFKVSGTGMGLGDDRLAVAVAGGRLALRVVWSRPLPSRPTSVTVFCDRAGRWWASFVCRIEVPDAPVAPTGRTTGIDVGLATFATTEDPNSDVANPRFAKAAAKALARSQRHMARKKLGSKGRGKARRRKAELENRTANQRADFQHKAARNLVCAYDRIGVEKLQVKNMSRRAKGRSKAALNRSIADAGWGQFGRTLSWQAAKAGKTVVALDARDTTQRCSTCGAKAKPRIELSDRVFSCRCCGLVLGRDRNAARNLNPDRHGVSAGGAGTAGTAVPVGDDGSKTKVPAGAEAA
ncbi:MAG TPA: transposase [Acidimicrobiales bacterium]|nr:transposase [Acidimicrobiales bacterium]